MMRQRLPNRRGHELLTLNARAAAVAAPLLLQHGCSVDTLRQVLTRNSDGSGSGPLACALDRIAEWR